MTVVWTHTDPSCRLRRFVQKLLWILFSKKSHRRTRRGDSVEFHGVKRRHKSISEVFSGSFFFCKVLPFLWEGYYNIKCFWWFIPVSLQVFLTKFRLTEDVSQSEFKSPDILGWKAALKVESVSEGDTNAPVLSSALLSKDRFNLLLQIKHILCVLGKNCQQKDNKSIWHFCWTDFSELDWICLLCLKERLKCRSGHMRIDIRTVEPELCPSVRRRHICLLHLPQRWFVRWHLFRCHLWGRRRDFFPWAS